MGNSANKLKIPGMKYFKNFNLENRAFKKIEKQEGDVLHFKLAPRHPSTAKILQEHEEHAPKLDEFQINKRVTELSKGIKISGHGPEHQEELLPMDKRPRKENETSYSERKFDVDYEKYGYNRPNKIKAGNLTLRQFDEFINQYKEKKSIDFINEFAAEHKVEVTNLHMMLEYYKPFSKLGPKKKSENNQLETGSSATEIFPNLK